MQDDFLNKKIPDRINYLSRTNKAFLSAVPPRIHGRCRALSRILTYPRHVTSAPRRRILRSDSPFVLSFDCALSGPFDNLFLTCLSPPQALCKGIIAVISASTVYRIKFLYMLTFELMIVKHFVEKIFRYSFAAIGILSVVRQDFSDSIIISRRILLLRNISFELIMILKNNPSIGGIPCQIQRIIEPNLSLQCP